MKTVLEISESDFKVKQMEVAQLCHDPITTKTMGFSKPEH